MALDQIMRDSVLELTEGGGTEIEVQEMNQSGEWSNRLVPQTTVQTSVTCNDSDCEYTKWSLPEQKHILF